jgi:hypothetical protein
LRSGIINKINDRADQPSAVLLRRSGLAQHQSANPERKHSPVEFEAEKATTSALVAGKSSKLAKPNGKQPPHGPKKEPLK